MSGGSASAAVAAGERDAALARAGWQRRFVAGPPELGDIVDLYQRTGYAVHLEPAMGADLPDGCGGCSLATTFFRVIYVREKS
jgi:hypothetical protein